MLAGLILFGAAFRIRVNSLGALIDCKRCDWRQVYALRSIRPSDGIADGGRAYTTAEIEHLQHLGALEDAAEEHTDHINRPQYATI